MCCVYSRTLGTNHYREVVLFQRQNCIATTLPEGVLYTDWQGFFSGGGLERCPPLKSSNSPKPLNCPTLPPKQLFLKETLLRGVLLIRDSTALLPDTELTFLSSGEPMVTGDEVYGEGVRV